MGNFVDAVNIFPFSIAAVDR